MYALPDPPLPIRRVPAIMYDIAVLLTSQGMVINPRVSWYLTGREYIITLKYFDLGMKINGFIGLG